MSYAGATLDILRQWTAKNDWLLALVLGSLAAIGVAFFLFFLSSNVEATLSEICARYDTNGDGEVDADGVRASVDDFNAGLITYEELIAVIDCFNNPDGTPTPTPTPSPTPTPTATPTPTPTVNPSCPVVALPTYLAPGPPRDKDNYSYRGTWDTTCHSNYYTFALTSTAHVTIDLVSASKDSLLVLRERDGTVIKVNDNNEEVRGQTDARIAQQLILGHYRIDATVNSGETITRSTSYTLTIRVAHAIPALGHQADYTVAFRIDTDSLPATWTPTPIHPIPPPGFTPTPRPTATATPRPTATATPRPTATATPRPTATATPTVIFVDPTPTPTATATPCPGGGGDAPPGRSSRSDCGYVFPTFTPTVFPTFTPTPTATPCPGGGGDAPPGRSSRSNCGGYVFPTFTPTPTATATPFPGGGGGDAPPGSPPAVSQQQPTSPQIPDPGVIFPTAIPYAVNEWNKAVATPWPHVLFCEVGEDCIDRSTSPARARNTDANEVVIKTVNGGNKSTRYSPHIDDCGPSIACVRRFFSPFHPDTHIGNLVMRFEEPAWEYDGRARVHTRYFWTNVVGDDFRQVSGGELRYLPSVVMHEFGHAAGLEDLYNFKDSQDRPLYPGYLMDKRVSTSIPLNDKLYLQQVYRNAHGASPHN